MRLRIEKKGKAMAAIKRSFYIVLAVLAILLTVPFITSFEFYGSNMASVTKSTELAAGILLTRSQTPDIKAADSFGNVHALSQTSHSGSSNSDVMAPEEALGDVPYSTTFNIAVNYTNPVEITEAEKIMIAATVQLEVVGKYSKIYQFENPDLKYYEMLAVAQIIKNRMGNPYFPSTPAEIIHHKMYKDGALLYQFATSPEVSSTTPSEAALAAVEEVFTEGASVLPDDYVYFCATWRESGFEMNNSPVLKFVGTADDYDKIVADATTFYAGVTMKDNIAHNYVY